MLIQRLDAFFMLPEKQGTYAMRSRGARYALTLGMLLTGAGLSGCNQGNMWAPRQGTANTLNQQQEQQYAQMQEMHRRTGELDANNNDLHAQLAESQRSANVLREHIDALNTQLAETSSRLDASNLGREELQQQLTALQASTRRHGGATIVANTSLGRRLTAVQIPGVEVVQDGELVRMRLSVDALFINGSTHLQPQAAERIDQAAHAIGGAYPKNIVGVEGHSDNQSVSAPWQNSHQLTAAQAMAVLNRITQQRHIPTEQLFVLGHGANQPLVSNASLAGQAENRRIELVIYPETR